MVTKILNRPDRRFYVELVCLSLAIMAAIYLARTGMESEFRVIYSLDTRTNDQEIIKLINEADKYIYFAIYYFTRENIVQALVRAKNRGLDVRGITDAAASADSNKRAVEELSSAGVHMETQQHMDGIMHIKTIVTDKAYASGSYNWTDAATEANDEILEISRNDGVRKQYLSIIRRLLLKNAKKDHVENQESKI